MAQDLIHLEVATPKGLFVRDYEKTAKVQTVIADAVTNKGLAKGDAFELVFNGNVLKPTERPLVSFGLSGTVKLELVATGSGV